MTGKLHQHKLQRVKTIFSLVCPDPILHYCIIIKGFGHVRLDHLGTIAGIGCSNQMQVGQGQVLVRVVPLCKLQLVDASSTTIPGVCIMQCQQLLVRS